MSDNKEKNQNYYDKIDIDNTYNKKDLFENSISLRVDKFNENNTAPQIEKNFNLPQNNLQNQNANINLMNNNPNQGNPNFNNIQNYQNLNNNPINPNQNNLQIMPNQINMISNKDPGFHNYNPSLNYSFGNNLNYPTNNQLFNTPPSNNNLFYGNISNQQIPNNYQIPQFNQHQNPLSSPIQNVQVSDHLNKQNDNNYVHEYNYKNIIPQNTVSQNIPDVYNNQNPNTNPNEKHFMNNNYNPIQIQNQFPSNNNYPTNNPNIPVNTQPQQYPYHFNQNYPIYPQTPMSNNVPLNQSFSEPQKITTEVNHKKQINLYKFLYNSFMAVSSGIIANLVTFNIHIYENKKSIEHTQFPDSFKNHLIKFSSNKSVCSTYPFSFCLAFWEPIRKSVDYILRIDEKKLKDKYLNGNIDASLILKVFWKNIISSYLMGFIFSKPLNFFDSVVLGIAHITDKKKEKITESKIRDGVRDDFFLKIYRKLHNYSVIVYTSKIGVFFSVYEIHKFLQIENQQQAYFTNFFNGFLLSLLTNAFSYPQEIVRQKFAYELIYHNDKIFEQGESVKREPFNQEYNEIKKIMNLLLKDKGFNNLKYGMSNMFFSSFFTGITITLYEAYKI